MLSFDLPVLSVLICSFPSANAHLEAKNVCNYCVQAPSWAQAGVLCIRYYLQWVPSSVTGCMRRMAADGNAQCTRTWSTGHFHQKFISSKKKNYLEEQLVEGKMYWMSEGKIYFSIMSIKANYSLSLLYHPLKTHEMPLLKGVREYKQHY